MDALLNLLPGGSLTVVAAAVIAAVLSLFKAYSAGRSDAAAKQRLKEAEAHAKEMERVARAALARPAGRVSDDPNNRDNR